MLGTVAESDEKEEKRGRITGAGAALSKVLSSGKSSISDMVAAIGCTNAESRDNEGRTYLVIYRRLLVH